MGTRPIVLTHELFLAYHMPLPLCKDHDLIAQVLQRILQTPGSETCHHVPCQAEKAYLLVRKEGSAMPITASPCWQKSSGSTYNRLHRTLLHQYATCKLHAGGQTPTTELHPIQHIQCLMLD